MTNPKEKLRIQIADAVRQAATELRRSDPDLAGFALCTDDDVRTIYHIACTRNWVREKEAGFPDIEFSYVEWTHSANDGRFQVISRQFDELADYTYASDTDWSLARD